ncbi:MAG: hypothetical protein PHD76_01060 [Methylacidiphilales bacterium]|nr:hypothetical protein [Candidatus Methylacidiphilales bacterium]
MEANLLFDLVLICIFTFTVLERSPKLLIALIFINFSQYMIWVPPMEEWVDQPQVAAEKTNPSPAATAAGSVVSNIGSNQGSDVMERVETIRKSSVEATETEVPSLRLVNPLVTMRNSMGLYRSICRALGADIKDEDWHVATVSVTVCNKNAMSSGTTRSTTQKEEVRTVVTRESRGAALSGDKLPPLPPEREIVQQREEEDSPSPRGSALVSAFGGDMEATWLIVRVFWILGTFYLYIQRPQIGAAAFAFNLLPVPFLSRLAPYLCYRLNQLPQVASINESLSRPLHRALPWQDIWIYGLAFMVLATPLFFILLGLLGGIRKGKVKKYINYLDPTRYRIRINGELLPFEIQNGRVVAEGIVLNPEKITPHPEYQNIWTLQTGTVVEFVEWDS